MTLHAVVRGAAGAVGVVVAALIGVVAIAAVTLVALGLPDQSRADDGPTPQVVQPRPDVLVVGLDLGDPVRQAGVVRDGEVVLARGLEVAIARDLARRLGIRRVRFVFVRPSERLVSTSAPLWHLAIASLRPTRETSSQADLSEPYLGTDQAVVVRRGLPAPASLSDLRERITCALRGSDGSRALAASVTTAQRPILVSSQSRLLDLVQTGVCDAALVDADDVGRTIAGRGGVLGPVAARVPFGGGSVIAVSRGGAVGVAEIDRALRRMRADGTMHRLARTWLRIDPARLRPLR